MSKKANKLVYVASPLRGDYERNTELARQYCKHVTDKGFIPYAPHLLFTQFMDDTIPEQRATGMAMGIEMLKRCDELWVFGETISEGMAAEIKLAKELGIPIHYIKKGITTKEAPARKQAPAESEDTVKHIKHRSAPARRKRRCNMAKISKYNQEGYKDPTPYEAIKRVKDPQRQLQGAQARVVGQYFEKMIDAACRFYEDRKVAVIEKTPEPMRPIKSLGGGKFVAHYEKQAQPDYKGTLATGRVIVFEAKHTSADKIEQSRLTDEQCKRLQKHSELGAITFILVSIDLQSFYRVPWGVWKNMKKLYGHKHMTIEELKPYKIKATGGIIRFLEGVEI